MKTLSNNASRNPAQGHRGTALRQTQAGPLVAPPLGGEAAGAAGGEALT